MSKRKDNSNNNKYNQNNAIQSVAELKDNSDN